MYINLINLILYHTNAQIVLNYLLLKIFPYDIYSVISLAI